MVFDAFAGLCACACGSSGLSFVPSSGASGRADTRTGPFGTFLGPFWNLSLALAPLSLFLLFGRLQEQALRPALFGRLTLQAPRHWAPASAGAQSLFERRQGQAPNDWAPTPAGVLLASSGRRLLQAPSV